jgi:hypothetical protein
MPGSRRALLVGINAYPGQPLAGCVADTAALAERLVARYAFRRADVRVVTDARATAAAIRARLAWLVAGAKPGDELVYAFSGHGVQVAARTAAGEVDGLDEAQVPVDFDWTDGTLIRDDDLATVFVAIPAGAHLTVISDSCHSGTLAREWSPIRRLLGRTRRARTMTVHGDLVWRNAAAQGHKRNGRVPVLAAGAWLEACRATQTAADAWFGRKPRGAFSYCFGQALDRDPNVTLADLRVLVGRGLTRAGFGQDPVFEGAELHRPFLGGVREATS